MEEVRQVFNRTQTTMIDDLLLSLSPEEDTVPNDILVGKQPVTISLACNSPQNVLKVDRDAFTSSRDYTTGFYLSNCDLSQVNLTFLDGLNQIRALGFESTPNLQFSLASTLPSLPSLTFFSIYKCPDFGQIKDQFPTLSTGLTSFYVDQNDWNDVIMSNVLEWALKSSATTVGGLYLSWNKLTGIPKEVASFTKLNYLWFYNNAETMSIKPGSFNFQLPLQYLDLTNSSIVDIQEGAFQGIYRNMHPILISNIVF